MKALTAPTLLFALSTLACACEPSDEMDELTTGGSPRSGGALNTGGNLGSGGVSGSGGFTPSPVPFEDLSSDDEVSDLSADEVMALCQEVDRRLGLLGDLPAACQYEAWTASFTEDTCEQLVSLCKDGGSTLDGYELPRQCAVAAATVANCSATVEEVIACADEDALFREQRTCEESQLFDSAPTCVETLAADCSDLYESSQSGGISGSGGEAGSGGTVGSGGSVSIGQCLGSPADCSAQLGELTCGQQQGCTWSATAEACEGTPAPCALLDSTDCILQDGCTYSF